MSDSIAAVFYERGDNTSSGMPIEHASRYGVAASDPDIAPSNDAAVVTKSVQLFASAQLSVARS